jgi:tripartite-type tricarboxylate transporter receptor subunit TctC
MKKLVINLLGIFLILVLLNLGYAQEKYPNRPVEVIGIWSAGGSTDLATRALCEAVKKHFGQPWMIIEKPGAGGMIGMAHVARAKPDGYTICAQAGTGQTVIGFFLQDTGFKQDDFEPVVQWSSYHLTIATRADSPWKTMMDLVEHAKKNPSEIKYATFGKGSSPHFQMEVLARQMGVKLTPVFYKGTTDAIPPILDGIIPVVGGAPYDSVKEHARAGKLRILMTLSPQGIEEAPEIPTFKQALGKEQKLFPSYNSVVVPKGTPEDRKKFIHDCVKKALDDSDFKKAMKQLNFPIVYNDGDAVKKRIQEETKIIGELVKELGMGK